ncbi:helix-turn-helix transcriptional regulator [Clostridiaceae bacterium 35-E11]
MLNGKKLREIRITKGYTSRDLSIITNVSKSYIEELERGDKNNPTFSIVERLADALGVELDKLRIRTVS